MIYPSPDLASQLQQEREREVSSARLARLGACYRAWRNPGPIDRLFRAVHRPRATC